MFDPQLTPARPDLAALSLQGVLAAERYVRPVRKQCARPRAVLRASAAEGSATVGEIAFGEAFDVLETTGGLAWGQARRDGRVGYVEAAALAVPLIWPTHRVHVDRAEAYAEPAARAAIAVHALDDLVTVEDRRDGFARLARSGWVREGDLSLVTDVR